MAKSKTVGMEQKAAAVVVALGTEKASKLYKYLSTDEVETLTLEVAKLGHLQAEETEQILDDFYKNCLTQKVVTDGGVEYARAVLEKAYGEDMADELLRKCPDFLRTVPLIFYLRLIRRICLTSFRMNGRRQSPSSFPTWNRTRRRICWQSFPIRREFRLSEA